jgi:phospholipid-translocating ATPase
MGSFFVTTAGWFAWSAFLNGIYAPNPSGPYVVKSAFTQLYGRDPYWWLTLFSVLGIIGLLEMVMKTVYRNLVVLGMWRWPPWQRRRFGDNAEEWDLEFWQEMEQDPVVWERFKKMARDEDVDEVEGEEVEVSPTV